MILNFLYQCLFTLVAHHADEFDGSPRGEEFRVFPFHFGEGFFSYYWVSPS